MLTNILSNYRLSTLLYVLVCLLSVNLTATNYYVKTTGNSNKNGLTWDNAKTLNSALSIITNGDIVHIAAGTYVPTVALTGGTMSGDITFEIKNNITLIGGYPSNAVNGSVANNTEKTILSGNLGTSNVYHVVCVTATPETSQKVTLMNLSITAGKAAVYGTNPLSVNGLSYPRSNGGAMIIAKSTVELNNCHINNNQSLYSTPGVYVFAAANVLFENCTIENNIGSGNGGGLWNDGSTVNLNNSTISSNQVTGVGAGIYAFNALIPSKTYIFNSTIKNNTANHKAGYYGRENSVGVLVNSTISGNKTTSTTNGGGGVSLYAANKSVNATKLDVISSTITDNEGALSDGGGIRLNDQYCKLYINNSIVSGNANGDITLMNGATYQKKFSIISDQVFDAYGELEAGKTFDAKTMLAGLAENGGYTQTCALFGNNNPALSSGMSSSQLISLASKITSAIPITPTGEKLVIGTDLFDNISSDTTYRVTDGVMATEIKYTSTASLPMKLFVFEVDLTNPNINIEVSTANNYMAGNAYSRQKMTQQAILKDTPGHSVYGGVNGDFFNLTTGEPQGILYKDGTAIKTTFQDAVCTFFAITKDKKAIIASQSEYNSLKTTLKEAIGGRVWLIKNGSIVTQSDKTLEPRTCIGVSKDNQHVYILAVDGRSSTYSNGMSYGELSKCLLALGSNNAINLDGGGSTTFFVRNTPNFTLNRFELRNSPTDTAGERSVTNGLLFISSK